MKALTAKQQTVLDVLQRHQPRTPRVREIGREIGVSSSCTVVRHLTALERKGFIRFAKPEHGYRRIQIVGLLCRCGAAPELLDSQRRPWCHSCAGVVLGGQL